jgi:hypothetical protein
MTKNQRMTIYFHCRKHFLSPIALAFLFSAAAYSASAQIIPALQAPPQFAVFGSFTDVKPNYVSFSDYAVYGFSAGGYLQTRHVVGLEIRGSIARWGGYQHEESAMAGPRASLHFGRFSPYVALLGGEANSWSRTNPSKTGLPTENIEEVGPAWSILGGIDVHLKHRLSLRMGELSYSQIYRNDKMITPISASAGIVYRVNWPSPRER